MRNKSPPVGGGLMPGPSPLPPSTQELPKAGPCHSSWADVSASLGVVPEVFIATNNMYQLSRRYQSMNASAKLFLGTPSYFLTQLNCSSDYVLVSMKLQWNIVKLSEIEFYFVFIGHFRIFFFILSWSCLVNSWMTALPDSSDALQCAVHIVECFSQNCFPTQYTSHILHGLSPGPPTHTTFS